MEKEPRRQIALRIKGSTVTSRLHDRVLINRKGWKMKR